MEENNELSTKLHADFWEECHKYEILITNAARLNIKILFQKLSQVLKCPSYGFWIGSSET